MSKGNNDGGRPSHAGFVEEERKTKVASLSQENKAQGVVVDGKNNNLPRHKAGRQIEVEVKAPST